MLHIYITLQQQVGTAASPGPFLVMPQGTCCSSCLLCSVTQYPSTWEKAPGSQEACLVDVQRCCSSQSTKPCCKLDAKPQQHVRQKSSREHFIRQLDLDQHSAVNKILYDLKNCHTERKTLQHQRGLVCVVFIHDVRPFNEDSKWAYMICAGMVSKWAPILSPRRRKHNTPRP